MKVNFDQNLRCSHFDEFYRKDPTAITQGNSSKFDIRQLGLFESHESQVWRVSWNVIGTVLVSSGADGCVRMWKGKTTLLLSLTPLLCKLNSGIDYVIIFSENNVMKVYKDMNKNRNDCLY